MKTVLQIGFLLGLLPSLAIVGVMRVAVHMGAADWSGPFAFVVFGAIYLALVGIGAWAFSRLRY